MLNKNTIPREVGFDDGGLRSVLTMVTSRSHSVTGFAAGLASSPHADAAASIERLQTSSSDY
jgi:hypothetical protein